MKSDGRASRSGYYGSGQALNWFSVSDATVALHAGFAFSEGALVFFGGEGILRFQVHGFLSVAVAAFPRVARNHAIPDTIGHAPSVSLEFLFAVNGAHNLMPNVFGGQQFCPQFWHGFMRNMTVFALRPHASRVAVMNGLLPFSFDPLHGMAGSAEFSGVGGFQSVAKTIGKNNAAENKSGDRAS